MTDPHFRITEFSGCVRLSVTIRKAKQRKPVTRTTKPVKAPSVVLIQLPLPFVD